MATTLPLISSITAMADNNAPEKQREAFRAQIYAQIDAALEADQAELIKKAAGFGKVANGAIAAVIEKQRKQLLDYVNANIEDMIDNKQEVLHVSLLEEHGTDPAYCNGTIIKDMQRIVIFQR